MIHKYVARLLTLAVGLMALPGFAQSTNVPAINAPQNAPVVKPRPAVKILQLGDTAPALTIQSWVKGNPVVLQPGTNFYVLVFCKLTDAGDLAITNLTALQAKYRDQGLEVITVSSEAPELMRSFILSKGERVGFTVASDDLPARTARNYQIAFGQDTMPISYVINREGKVVWFGHPLTDDLGWVVDQIATGRFNPEQTKKEVLRREQMRIYMRLAVSNDKRQERAGRILLGLWTNDAPALCEFAFKVASYPNLEKRDSAAVKAALDRVAQISTTNATDIAVTRAILRFNTGEQAAGLADAKAILPNAKSEAEKLQVRDCIRVMEVKMAEAKTNRVNAAEAPASATAPAGQP